MKSKVTIGILLLIFFSFQIYAQQKSSSKNSTPNKDTSQSLIAHWKKGDTKTYTIIHTKVTREQEKPDSTSLTYWATMKVIDSSSNGYHLEWKYVLPTSGLSVPHANEIYEFFKGLNILFETSETGEFKGVSNWTELRDHYVKMFELSMPPKNDGKVDTALEKVKQMFNSRQIVESAMAKEIMLLLQGYGNSFSTKEHVVNSSLPNPFIPVKPIPAELSTKMFEMNSRLDYFKVRITQNIDNDGALELFESVFDKMDIPKDSVVAKAKEMLNDFEIKDNCEIKASISSGWIKNLYYVRTARATMMSQKDSYVIEEKN